MTIRLKNTSRSIVRTSLTSLTIGALVFGASFSPVYASETQTGPSVSITVSEATHQNAAKNVQVSVSGTTITINWQAATGYNADYVIDLKKDGRTLRSMYRKQGPLSFEAPLVEKGNTYTVTISALDRFQVGAEPGSTITSDPIVIASENTATPDPGNTPGPGAGTPGQQPPTQPSPTVPEGAPSAPLGVIASIMSDTSVKVDYLIAENQGSSQITSYKVKLTPQNGGQAVETEITDPQDLRRQSILIDGLTSGETYLVEVAAVNAAGTGPFTSPSHRTVKLSPTPETKLAVSVPAGTKVNELNPAVPTTFTLAGTGFTGEVAETHGVDVVVADSEFWEPGLFPVGDFVKKIHVAPQQIKGGAFIVEVVIDPKADKLSLGKQYIIGTLAAGEAAQYERRLDHAEDFAYKPVAPRNVTAEKSGDKTVLVQWERPVEDPRITGYAVKLYRIEGDTETYVNQFERGRTISAVQFSNLKPGTYVATVASELANNNNLFVQPLRSETVRSNPVTLEAKPSTDETHVLAAPAKPTLRLAKNDSQGLEIFWTEPAATQGGKASAYELVLEGDNNTSRTLNADMNSDLPEYLKVTGLTPGVTYKVKVRAQNAHGWSQWSDYSDNVQIPADQDGFAMKVPDEVFVLVDKDTANAIVQWINSGYEPKTANWVIEITCVEACSSGFSPITRQVASSADSVIISGLPTGVYRASLKLVNGAKQAGPVNSENFTIGTPAVTPNPQITVTPKENIDPAVANEFTVTGTGYVGTSASRGIYLVVAETGVWTPGKAPKLSEMNRFAGTAHVKPTQIKDGKFTATVEVPAGKFDKAKTYVVGTMAAHELSISDRTMDRGETITFKTDKPGQEQPPAVTPNPQITVTPKENIDPAAVNVFTVTGTGYVGPAATRGVYVVVTDTQIWAPGKQPNLSEINKFAGTTYVRPTEIKDGKFTATVEVPVGKFDKSKTYVVGTMAAHELSIVDRSLDRGETITFKADTTPVPPVKPQPPVDPKVTALVAGKETNQFVTGQAVTLDLEFKNVAEGSHWKVALHSDPVDLGVVVVEKGRAKLMISAEVAAKFPVGAHNLVFTALADPKQVISLPWKVVAKPSLPKPGDGQQPGKPSLPKPGDGQQPGKPSLPKPGDGQQPGKPSLPKPGDGQQPGKPMQPAKPAQPSVQKTLPKTGADTVALTGVAALFLVAGGLAVRARRRA